MFIMVPFLVQTYETVAADFRPLHPVHVRQIDFKKSVDLEPIVPENFGDQISRDGTMLFSSLENGAFIDLVSGDLMFRERAWFGRPQGKTRWIIGTGSQWHHLKPTQDFSHATVADALSQHQWLIEANGKGIGWQVAFADVTSRSFPPNRQVVLSVQPFKDFSARWGQMVYFEGGVEHRVCLQTQSGACTLELRRWHPNGKVTLRRIPLPTTSHAEYPGPYDSITGNVRFPRFEYNIRTKRRVPLPRPTEVGYRYWRGNLIQISGSPNVQMALMSKDRKTETPLGHYSPYAVSSDQRWMLVRNMLDKRFWLLDFGTSME